MGGGNNEVLCSCCSVPSNPRESFIGRETVWTGWHKRPEPRDLRDTRDKCALRCAVDPEKRTENPCNPTASERRNLRERILVCEAPPYTIDYDTELAKIKEQLNDGKDKTKSDPLFENIAVGLVGTRRESMLENRLLHKHQIGIPMRCCREMPCPDFTYGHVHGPGWRMSDALRGWAGTGLKQPKQQKKIKIPKNMCCTDILALNRTAVNEGICTAKELRDYRNTHCLVFSKYARRGGERLPPVEVDKDHVYGKKTDYITNMSELLTDKELKDWQQCVRGCMREKSYEKTKSMPDPWKENTACILRTAHSVKGPQMESLWKMPRFENKAKPHLCTFRSDTAIAAAHKANFTERVGRQGFFGEGIRTKPERGSEKVFPYKN